MTWKTRLRLCFYTAGRWKRWLSFCWSVLWIGLCFLANTYPVLHPIAVIMGAFYMVYLTAELVESWRTNRYSTN